MEAMEESLGDREVVLPGLQLHYALPRRINYNGHHNSFPHLR